MKSKDSIILAIESSCDDTGAAVLKNRKILSNIVAGQAVHEAYGGVVPELASRAHQKNIIPVVDQAIKQAGIQLSDIDAIAFTSGPGLMGSLLVGTSFAKSFAYSLGVPLIDVHHMHAHVLAHFIEQDDMLSPPFPFLCLTVSGGHTQIVLVEEGYKLSIIGETIDDAAGEAFDKTAKLLNLPYPGGPLIDKYAQMGNPDAFSFNKPSIPDYNFSFSGLKTSILYFLQNKMKEDPEFVSKHLYDICASVQKTILDILFKKLEKASKDLKIKHIAIAGGVSANRGLRQRLKDNELKKKWTTYIPPFGYTTDNAAMIAIAGAIKLESGQLADLHTTASARLNF